MKRFDQIYLWGAETKSHMGLYTVAVVFCKGIADALTGSFSVDYLTLLEILLASFGLACIESAIFPSGRPWDERPWPRVALWVATANGVYLGGSLLFGWFAGIPLPGALLLVCALELGLGSMLYAIRLAARRDTQRLNAGLQSFQAREGA